MTLRLVHSRRASRQTPPSQIGLLILAVDLPQNASKLFVRRTKVPSAQLTFMDFARIAP